MQPDEIPPKQKELKPQTSEVSRPGVDGQPPRLADQQHTQAQKEPSGQPAVSSEPDSALSVQKRQEQIRILEEQRLQMVYEVEESTHRKRVKRKPTQEKTSSQSDGEHSCSEGDYTDEDEVQEEQPTEMPLLSTIQVIQRQISRQEEVRKRSESQSEDARSKALVKLPYQADLEHRPLSAVQAFQAKNRENDSQQEDALQASDTGKIRKMAELVEQHQATSQPFESALREKKELLQKQEREPGKIKGMAVKFEEIAGSQQYEVLARDRELKKLPMEFAKAKNAQSGHVAEEHFEGEIQVKVQPGKGATRGQETEVQPEKAVIANLQAKVEPEVMDVSEQEADPVERISTVELGNQEIFRGAENAQSGHVAEPEQDFKEEIAVKVEGDEGTTRGQRSEFQPQEVVIESRKDEVEPEVEAVSKQRDDPIAKLSIAKTEEEVEHQEILQEQDLSDSSEYSDDSILPNELDTLVQSIVQSRGRPESSGTSSSRFGTKALKEEPLPNDGSGVTDLKVEELQKSQELVYKPLSAIQVFHSNQRAEHEKRVAKKQKNAASADPEGSKGKVKKAAEGLEIVERPPGLGEMLHDWKAEKAPEKNVEESTKIKKMAEKFEEIAASQAYEVLARDKELRNLPLEISEDTQIEDSQPKLITVERASSRIDKKLWSHDKECR
uniref:A-kinase anchor protein 2 C-terminal domain-containing protein n=1 Tax=Ditylenchus dipsaci TaxID=166011 RepID=A0A915EQ96_9BILA